MNVLPQIDVDAATAQEGWYKDAIIYQLHVKAFADSNGDGVGDFAGLTERLDYLQDLGVTALWLQPFYPSPQRDDGYDIADYRRIHPDFGSLKDFRRFMHEAKRRNLRVITELVINHTSDQHPWFKRARRSSPGSDARNWYVWSNTDQRYAGTRIVFDGIEKSNWAWDPVAGAYYWHRFFSHQPDLNFDNPRVEWAVVQVMRRWLDMGVDGFRLDAIPYLCEREGTTCDNLPETHAVIKRLRAELDAYAPNKVLLAEANLWPEDVNAYFADGDECHMAFHFPLMPRIYMAIAQEDRFPIADILRQTPDIPANCQWALFLRNHDELTLEMVTDSERDYLWSAYATDPRARIYLGIRRRLAPLMQNDRRKIELMNSLLMSLPGTPIIYYGDEIGMGDNIYLGDRNGVRTPMQWTPDRNGGFSRADPAQLYAPVIMDAVYGYQTVNVEAQSRNISSLLSWMKRLIAVRKSTQVFGRGTLTFIRPENRSVLAYLRQYGDETILCIANLSRSAQAAELDLSQWKGRVPLEMLGRTEFPAITDAPFVVTLAPYGFFWFLLMEPGRERAARPVSPPELATLIVKDGWRELLSGRSRYIFDREVLPVFLPTRRWFAEKGRFVPHMTAALAPPNGDPGFLWSVIDVDAAGGRSHYSLPLTVSWQRLDRNAQSIAHVVAPVRSGAREGVLLDAAADSGFVSWLMAQLQSGGRVEHDNAVLRFEPSDAFRAGTLAAEEVRPVNIEQRNTTVFVGDSYAVKFFRRVHAGVNPDVELGRFLTQTAGYQNVPTLLGAVELESGGETYTLALVQQFVGNQGDGSAVTASYLDRLLEETRLLAPDTAPDPVRHAAFLLPIRQIGRRLAEIHMALASPQNEAAFAAEPLTAGDRTHWTEVLIAAARRVFDDLQRCRHTVSETARSKIDILLGQRDEVLAKMSDLFPELTNGVKIRHHGDFHLGQTLIAKDDVFIIDFEGRADRSLEGRRRKAPAAVDVAGLVRSIDAAAAAALDRMVPGSPDEQGRVVRALDEWRLQCVEIFLSGYQEQCTDERLMPADPAISAQLMRFFLIERAFYDLRDALEDRPSLLSTTVDGILRFLFPAVESADEAAPAPEA